MRITYVTGASGSGKTTLHEQLIEGGQAFVMELDDVPNGPPPAADVSWLQWRAAEHLHEATNLANGNAYEHHVVTGIVWPFALIQSNMWRPALDAGVEVRFVLLDRPWAAIARTLADRYENWDDAEEAAEQLDNNRRLQRALRTQVQAIHGGLVALDGDLFQASELVRPGATW